MWPMLVAPFPRLTLTALLLLGGLLPAQQASAARIDPAGIPGSLLIAGGGRLPEAVYARFVERAGGEEARIVVVPTATRDADDPEYHEQLRARFQPFGPASVRILHTWDRAQADQAEFCRPLREATGLWFGGGSQSRILDAYGGTRFERELHNLLQRDGIVGGSSAGAAIQSAVMITGGREKARTSRGFDLLPGAVVDQHFLARERTGRLLGVLAEHPERYGLGIDEGCAVLVDGRRVQVLGDSEARLHLAATADQPEPTVLSLPSGTEADLIAWQRAARQRAVGPWPPAELPEPVVETGTVMMVGGGAVGPEILTAFLEAAGGPEAPIVVVPTAGGRNAGNNVRFVNALAGAGAQKVRVFHASHPSEVDSAENLDFLSEARGLWFTGGRQWRLVDAYEGTRAQELFAAVLARGGVIGGSSAGTSIQTGFMVRGNPLGNRDIAALGYTRGFGYLPGVAADQHFTQRNRFPDMTRLMQMHPRLLGLGIDESTAVIVRGSAMRVLGPGQVAVYDYRDARAAAQTDGPDYIQLGDGERFDLVRRQRIE